MPPFLISALIIFKKFFQGLFFIIKYCLKLWDILVFLIVLCAVAPHFWQEIAANFNEPGATPFSMNDFPEGYAGQYWLKLEGELVLEHFHLEKEKASSLEKNPVRLYVPLVGPLWESRQPIHAVVIFHMEESEVNNWLNKYQLQRKYTASGVVENRNFPKQFPNLKAGSPLVFLRDQSRPKTIGEIIILSAFLILLLVIMRTLSKLAKKFTCGKSEPPSWRQGGRG